jgi:hypothetical protein
MGINTSGVEFFLINGNYTFNVSSAVPAYAPVQPSLTFSLSSLGVWPASAAQIDFRQWAYSVSYNESGLPNGTAWSITLDGVTTNSTASAIVFEEPNGSYRYAVGAPVGFLGTPSAGTITIVGAPPTSIRINFTSTRAYTLTFHETGLPMGTGWAVAVGSALSSARTANLTFSEENGTYDYVVLSVAGYTTNGSGVVSIAGGNRTVPLDFAPETFPVIVVEFGLPYGTNWTATVSNVSTGFSETKPTNTSTIIFFLPNGTYALNVTVPAGYSANVTTGTFTVAGPGSLSPRVGFAPVVAPPSTTSPASDLPWVVAAAAVIIAGFLAVLLLLRYRRPPRPSELWP